MATRGDIAPNDAYHLEAYELSFKTVVPLFPEIRVVALFYVVEVEIFGFFVLPDDGDFFGEN